MDLIPDSSDLQILLQPPEQWPNYHGYQPLDHSLRQIRLLQIWYAVGTEDIHARLRHVSLDEKPDYHALSYYWGPPDKQKPIYIEGQEVLIRRSLHCFLSVLCEKRQVLPVWLDSICINQRDIAERNLQVSMMGDIYRGAQRVNAGSANLMQTPIMHSHMCIILRLQHYCVLSILQTSRQGLATPFASLRCVLTGVEYGSCKK